MKILVTGGAGFIGSHLTEELVKRGHSVTVLDDFSLGAAGNLENVKGRVKIIKGSICDAALVKKLTKGADIVFNEAAASSSPMFLKDLNYAASVNINGFINVLNACRDNGVRKLIYASSSSIYGNVKPPVREDMYTPPVNFYASTKLMNEHLASLFSRQYGLQTIGFRYMSVYGPHEKSKGDLANLASQFMWAMMKGESPVIYGDGKQAREFTYVSDIVNANVLAMGSKKDLSGEVLNVGTGKTTSLNELVALINKILGKSVKPTYVQNTVKNYISVQLSDISRIKRLLGYRPEKTLEMGLKELAALQ